MSAFRRALGAATALVLTANVALAGGGVPLGPSGYFGGGGASLNGPGYVSGVYYLPFGVQSRSSAGVAPAATTSMYCSPFWVGNVSATGGGSGTLGVILGAISTAGTTTAQASIYSNDTAPTAGGAYRPGAQILPISNQPSTTSGQPAFVFTSGPSLSANTLYWTCLQFGDTTIRYDTLPSTTTGSQSSYSNLVGTTAAGLIGAGGTAPINGIVTTVSAYGTFPTTLHGATMTETPQGPWFAIQFSSIP
jgi:hypothetical protein